jgi:hypothetical protein
MIKSFFSRRLESFYSYNKYSKQHTVQETCQKSSKAQKKSSKICIIFFSDYNYIVKIFF